MPVPEKIISTVDTPVEHYQIVERTYEGRPARVLFSGARRAAQSGIALDDDPDLLFDYNQRLLEIANGVYPKSILMIGGGAYTLPMALLAALPDVQLTVIELDAGLEAISKQYFGLTKNERLNLVFADGREYLESSAWSFDLIILDVFSELHIPDQFLSYEFIKLLKTRLNHGGTVAMNIIASYKGKNDGLIKSQIAAYDKTFDYLQIYPAAYGLTSWLPQNLVLVAQTQPAEDITPYIRYKAIEIPNVTADDIVVDDPN